jgi:indole-3-glycerol phosphate synthase
MILERILKTKESEVSALKARTSASELERQIATLAPCLGFKDCLLSRPKRKIGLIAEVKKASPSKGIIRADFSPVTLAQTYEQAGADCLSVLTDEQYFQGSNEYLKAIREHVQIPILRKEFIVDELQILEARTIGADAILLIAAALTTKQMREFHQLAVDVGMDVLVEVHDREELERALELELHLLGINNRNLKTFVTDLRVTEQLMQYIPENIAVVSESGIASADDVRYLQQIGSKALLIGETFMRQADVGLAVQQLMEPVS